MDENLAKLVDFFTGLVVDAGKEKLKEYIDQRKLCSSLRQYVERELNLNEICGLAEEIDFQGLVDCVDADLQSSARKAVFELDPEIKERARKHIVNVAAEHSAAHTKESKQKVERIISNCLNIICDHYWQEINKNDLLLASAVVNTIDSRAQERHREDQDRFDHLDGTLQEIVQTIQANQLEAISGDYIDALFIPGAQEAVKPFLKKVLENRTGDGWHPRITVDGATSSEVTKAVATILEGCNCLKSGWSITGRNGIQGTFSYGEIEKYLDEKD